MCKGVAKDGHPRQPAIDFSPVLECIIENRVAVDLSPVLTAVNEAKSQIICQEDARLKAPSLEILAEAFALTEELTLQEDMSKQFAAILEEIDRKQGQIDFSEVLDAIRTTCLSVFFWPCADVCFASSCAPQPLKEDEGGLRYGAVQHR